MNKVRKLYSIPIVIILILMLTTCFAVGINSNDSFSGEQIQIDSFEEYEELMNQENGFTQSELKEYYEYYMKNYKMHIENEFERTSFVKALVTNVKSPKEKYGIDSGYQGEQQYTVPYKYKSQLIEVEILEGEYQGQKFEIEYILNADMLDNLKYSALKKGDTVFVTTNVDQESNEVVVKLSEDGVNVERFGIVVCVGIITIVLLLLYGGKKGIISSLIILLLIIFCVGIIPNMYNSKAGITLSSACLMVLLITTVSILNLGVNIKALKSTILSSILTLATMILIIFINGILNITGATIEAIAFSNLTMATGVNLEILYIISTLIIASLVITNVVCKTILKLLEEKPKKEFNEKLEVCKNIIHSNVLTVAVTLLALYIPNHLYLVTNKYMGIEICNAETLISEITRLFILVIAICLSVPAVVTFITDEK